MPAVERRRVALLRVSDHPVERAGRHPRVVRRLRCRAARARRCCTFFIVRAESLRIGAYPRNESRSATSSTTCSRCSVSTRSHLLSTITTAVPAASMRSPSRWSWWATPCGRVDHEQRGVGLVDRVERAHDRGVLGLLLDLALPPHPRGVDEPQRSVVGLDDGVDRVHRRARHVVHDRAVVADQPVEQRRLPHVRPADDRDRERAVVLGHRRPVGRSGQRVDERVEQVAAPPPVDRGDRERVAEAELDERPDVRSRGSGRRPC